jgi:acyl transferase domain-containing protein
VGRCRPSEFTVVVVATTSMKRGRINGGFIDNVSDFDAEFYNLSPREARSMDPRQRLASELTRELLESSRFAPHSGKQVSVYIGAMYEDYALLRRCDCAKALDHHSSVNLKRGSIANRISSALGLRDASLTFDCGQSSSRRSRMTMPAIVLKDNALDVVPLMTTGRDDPE